MEKVKNQIDLKSLLIGFLMATVLFLLLGAGYNRVQEVKIVGFDTYDSLRVDIQNQPIKIENK